MKLYFSGAELLLRMVAGEYILEMAGKEIGRFGSEKKAVSEFNRIRRELEVKLPPPQLTDADKQAMLQRYLADNLIGDCPDRPPPKKRGRSRTFG